MHHAYASTPHRNARARVCARKWTRTHMGVGMMCINPACLSYALSPMSNPDARTVPPTASTCTNPQLLVNSRVAL